MSFVHERVVFLLPVVSRPVLFQLLATKCSLEWPPRCSNLALFQMRLISHKLYLGVDGGSRPENEPPGRSHVSRLGPAAAVQCIVNLPRLHLARARL